MKRHKHGTPSAVNAFLRSSALIGSLVFATVSITLPGKDVTLTDALGLERHRRINARLQRREQQRENTAVVEKERGGNGEFPPCAMKRGQHGRHQPVQLQMPVVTGVRATLAARNALTGKPGRRAAGVSGPPPFGRVLTWRTRNRLHLWVVPAVQHHTQIDSGPPVPNARAA